MSDHDEVMDTLAALGVRVNWCVQALKMVLQAQIGDMPGLIPIAEVAAFQEDLEPVEEPIPAAPHIGVAVRPPPACPHNQQVLVGGKLTCGRCGALILSTGIIQDRLSPDGARIVRDPNPPQDHFREGNAGGASARNPGSPLVPHTS